MKIESFFSNIKTANQTVEKLKEQGFKAAYVDMNDHNSGEMNTQPKVPGTEEVVSLSGLVLSSDAQGGQRDKAPLKAASPMVSGYGRFEEVADVNCRVVVETRHGNADKAKRIIQDMGGDLESPYVKKPRLENVDETVLLNSLYKTRDFIDNELND